MVRWAAGEIRGKGFAELVRGGEGRWQCGVESSRGDAESVEDVLAVCGALWVEEGVGERVVSGGEGFEGEEGEGRLNHVRGVSEA